MNKVTTEYRNGVVVIVSILPAYMWDSYNTKISKCQGRVSYLMSLLALSCLDDMSMHLASTHVCCVFRQM